MNKLNIRHFMVLVLLAASLNLLSGCGSQGADQSAVLSPTATPTLTATPTPTATPQPSPTPQPAAAGTAGAEAGGSDSSSLVAVVPTLAEMVPTRTPAPTETPGAVTQGIEQVVQYAGLSGRRLLGLEYADWINLGISLLYVLAGYIIGTWSIRWPLPRIVRRTKTALDDQLLQTSGSEVRWLVVVIILRAATDRLEFVNADVKTVLADVYYSLTLVLAILILWQLISLAAQQAISRAGKTHHQKEAESLITLTVWGARLAVIVIAISLGLAYFGVNITGFAVFLGIIGLAISLAGRDVLADIISGALILVDRPYRIGDRIALPAIDSWGDVVDIGMRSTRILTLNNRMVIVPNSQIGKDQIVNFTYPDPSYYDSTDVVVAYDNAPEQVGQLLVDTVRSVEGVQKERDIDALLMKFTENQVVFQVGWWIATYDDLYPVHDRVSRAVIQALRDAGVVLPYTTGSVRVERNSGQA